MTRTPRLLALAGGFAFSLTLSLTAAVATAEGADPTVSAASDFPEFEPAKFESTPSGLKYRIIEAGSEVKPIASDTVEVHYAGTFEDGNEFDSSYKRGQTATFPLGGVIKGWTEGLQLIGEGGKIQLIIPPDLAYGPGGRPGIPPNSTLRFNVELIDVK